MINSKPFIGLKLATGTLARAFAIGLWAIAFSGSAQATYCLCCHEYVPERAPIESVSAVDSNACHAEDECCRADEATSPSSRSQTSNDKCDSCIGSFDGVSNSIALESVSIGREHFRDVIFNYQMVASLATLVMSQSAPAPSALLHAAAPHSSSQSIDGLFSLRI